MEWVIYIKRGVKIVKSGHKHIEEGFNCMDIGTICTARWVIYIKQALHDIKKASIASP
jgi:hypothetical protein